MLYNIILISLTVITNILLGNSKFIIPLNSLGPDDSYFLTSNIQLGSNKQNIKVEIDTGSSELWVTSNNCKLKKRHICAGDHFNPISSTSYIGNIVSTEFYISYDDGTSFNGNFVKDTLQVGNGTYQNFIFGLVNSEKVPSDSIDFNIGILGLVKSPSNEISSSLLDYWYHDSNILVKQFSLYLPKELTNQGEMMIGGNDPQRYIQNTLKWFDVILNDYAWYLPLTSFETLEGISLTSSIKPYVDTGSDYIYMPYHDMKAFCKHYSLTYSKDYCYTTCIKLKTMPNFVININGIKLVINIQNNFYFPIGQGDCAIAITGNSDVEGITLGIAFIRQFYTIFDFQDYNISHGKIGFANVL